jgi:polyhydroxyalkanoate synthesis regulator phasin
MALKNINVKKSFDFIKNTAVAAGFLAIFAYSVGISDAKKVEAAKELVKKELHMNDEEAAKYVQKALEENYYETNRDEFNKMFSYDPVDAVKRRMRDVIDGETAE